MGGLYGRLSVKGPSLVGEDGDKVMLRGISTHGIHWFPEYVNKACFRTLRDQWRANVIRLAMYVEEGGYTQNKNLSLSKMYEGIEACLSLGLYVIVDWHVSNADQTPVKHWGEAIAFFQEIAQHYGDNEQILYEICNEPNNAGNDYGSQIAPYANAALESIRKFAPSAVCIIGSGMWSKYPYEAWIYDAKSRKNVLYTLHRYCDGDFDKGWWNNSNDGWSPQIRKAVAEGCPIIATEAGVSNAGEWNWDTQDEFRKIIAFYEELGISWQIWSLADKVEPSSILAANAPSDGNWGDQQISKAGQLVKDCLIKYDDAAKPNPKPIPFPTPPPVVVKDPDPVPPAPAPVPAPAPAPAGTVTIGTVTIKKGVRFTVDWGDDGITISTFK